MSSILKISEAVSLAIHAVIITALRDGERVSTSEIAEAIDASGAHLSKVMQRLVKAGLVKSNRGPGGGFVLADKPSKIKLVDIYLAIEGSFPHSNCLFEKKICGKSECFLGGFLKKINTECSDYFKNTTIADLISSGGK
ncbi:MAG: hypothetical protein A2020_08755 [Lentisphaerae bacterium GWF2_45_14]|nr:MAG: hypothetical protein A2020_08755 [Lentisphaerae bacterium GWF2_45_14]